jgi:hypothetical protein
MPHPSPQGQSVPPRRPRRIRYPDLSPTKARVIRRDELAWPGPGDEWVDMPVEQLNPDFIANFPCRED